MTHEQLQIQAAYGQIVQHLERYRDKLLQEALECPDEYEGITTDDAYTWFAESL